MQGLYPTNPMGGPQGDALCIGNQVLNNPPLPSLFLGKLGSNRGTPKSLGIWRKTLDNRGKVSLLY